MKFDEADASAMHLILVFAVEASEETLADKVGQADKSVGWWHVDETVKRNESVWVHHRVGTIAAKGRTAWRRGMTSLVTEEANEVSTRETATVEVELTYRGVSLA